MFTKIIETIFSDTSKRLILLIEGIAYVGIVQLINQIPPKDIALIVIMAHLGLSFLRTFKHHTPKSNL
jgi:hypothetical protein